MSHTRLVRTASGNSEVTNVIKQPRASSTSIKMIEEILLFSLEKSLHAEVKIHNGAKTLFNLYL